MATPSLSAVRRSAAALSLAALAFLAGCAGDPTAGRGGPRDGAAQALIKAAKKANVPRMRELLDAGANVNAREADGTSALMLLVDDDRYHQEAVDLLLARHADANVVNADGATALLIAAGKACPPADAGAQNALVAALLRGGADANAHNLNGLLPVQVSAFVGQPGPCIDLLAKATTTAPANGYSPLSEAALGDQRTAEDYLIAQGLRPQDLPPALPPPGAGPPEADDGLAITTRANDALGDYLAAAGQAAAAQDAYGRSYLACGQARADYANALDWYTKALKAEKAKRFGKVMTAVVANVAGVGLGVATGFGVAFIPRKGAFANRVDDYSDEVDRLRTALASLQREQAALEAKLHPPGPGTPAPPTAAAARPAKS